MVPAILLGEFDIVMMHDVLVVPHLFCANVKPKPLSGQTRRS